MKQASNAESDGEADEMSISVRPPKQAPLVQGSIQWIVVINYKFPSHTVGHTGRWEPGYYDMAKNMGAQEEGYSLGTESLQVEGVGRTRVPDLGQIRGTRAKYTQVITDRTPSYIKDTVTMVPNQYSVAGLCPDMLCE